MNYIPEYSTLGRALSCDSIGGAIISRRGVLHYGFKDSVGYSAALHAWKLHSRDRSALGLVDGYNVPNDTDDDETHNSSTGIISASLLHQVCGPYPQNFSDPNDLFHHIFLVYILPIIAVLVLITNILVCYVFLKQHLRNPVYTILLVIAIFEGANTLIPLPMYIAQSITHRKVWWEDLPQSINKFIPPVKIINDSWGLPPKSIYQTSSHSLASLISAWTTVFLPTVAHTVSVLLTVLLALQRLVYVTCPLKAPRWCSLNYSRGACFVVVVIAILLHSNLYGAKFIQFTPIIIKTTTKHTSSNENLNFSKIYLSQIISSLPHIVMKCHFENPFWMVFYFWSRIIIIHLLPCGILIVLTTLIVLAMKEVAKRRLRLGLASHTKNKINMTLSQCKTPILRHLVIDNQPSGLRNISQYNLHSRISNINIPSLKTTGTNSPAISLRKQFHQADPLAVSKMLITVLIKFLIVHIPNAVVILCYTIDKMRTQPNQIQPNWTECPNESMLHDKPIWSKLEILCNILILISYQLNFVIYWKISTGFRNTLIMECNQILCKSVFKTNAENQKSTHKKIKQTNGNFIRPTHLAALRGTTCMNNHQTSLNCNVMNSPCMNSECAKSRLRLHRSFRARHCHLPILFCCEDECSYRTGSLTKVENIKSQDPAIVYHPSPACSMNLNEDKCDSLDQSCSLIEGDDKEGYQQPSSDI